MAPVRGSKTVPEVLPCLSQQNGARRARARRPAAPEAVTRPPRGSAPRGRAGRRGGGSRARQYRAGLLGVPRPPSVLAVSSHLKIK